MHTNVMITGTGSYVPENIITNAHFETNIFYDPNGKLIEAPNEEIIKKFKAITGIEQRRYINKNQTASDIGTIAAKLAIEDSGVNPEDIDQIIVAHNFGDVIFGTIQSDAVPSIASRIKHNLQIENPSCVCYDLLFGCPGWLQGIIQAQAYIKSEIAKKCLIISAETLSRVIDKYDRDSMFYADGAGACIVEAVKSNIKEGVIGTESASYTKNEAHYLFFGEGNNNEADPKKRYLKMNGHKIYEFALTHVPMAMKKCLEKSESGINDVSKIFIHQANEKMDDEIIKRFYRLYNERKVPKDVTPMNIHKFGNSSVGTIPTLFDMVRKGKCEGNHQLNKGDLILFSSVGAGMNINAIAYRY